MDNKYISIAVPLIVVNSGLFNLLRKSLSSTICIDTYSIKNYAKDSKMKIEKIKNNIDTLNSIKI